MKRGEIRYCSCGCGNPAAVYRDSKGENKGWRGYASGHAPNEAVEIRVPTDLCELAYGAGIIDGEGCIFAKVVTSPGRTLTYVALLVTMCSETVIQWLHTKFGGEVYISAPPSAARRERFHWRVSGAKVAVILNALLPFLLEKQERAKLAIALSNLIFESKKRGPRTKIPQDEIQIRQNLAGQIKQYNQNLRSEDTVH